MVGNRAKIMVVVAALALASCVAQDDPAASAPNIVIATGGTEGVYYQYGQLIAEMLEEELATDVEVRTSSGSVENALAVALGEAHIGFATADVAADALDGAYSAGVPLRLVAVTRLYDDVIHLVVRDDSGIESLEDLRGRDVSLGASGSGTGVIARRLLHGAGIATYEVSDAQLGINESVDALASGDIDAFFWSGGLPTGGVSRLFDTHPVRMVALGEAIEDMRARFGPVYRQTVVPAEIYGDDDEVTTIAVPNFLLSSNDIDAGVIRTLLTVLYENQAELANAVPVAAELNSRLGIQTAPLDLHDDALAYFRETKP